MIGQQDVTQSKASVHDRGGGCLGGREVDRRGGGVADARGGGDGGGRAADAIPFDRLRTGGAPVRRQDVHVGSVRTRIPKWQAWGKAAKAKLDVMTERVA